ncbi:hypothetical protein GCM10010532_083340 [Dactylosporangium siamense]
MRPLRGRTLLPARVERSGAALPQAVVVAVSTGLEWGSRRCNPAAARCGGGGSHPQPPCDRCAAALPYQPEWRNRALRFPGPSWSGFLPGATWPYLTLSGVTWTYLALAGWGGRRGL